ncbi:MAG: rod-binding protein [Candidatus Wallbacteria bacterium]
MNIGLTSNNNAAAEVNRQAKVSAADFNGRINKITTDKSLSRDEKLEKLKDAAKDFESIFVHSLIKTMRSSVPKDGLISGGNAENIYQDMLDEQYSKIIVKRADMGIAKNIYEQFSKTVK